MSGKSFWKKHGFLSFFILVFVVGIVFWLLKAPILAFYLSNKLKIPVSLTSINISKKHMKINNFSIKNPLGEPSSYALRTKKIDVQYDWANLKQSPSVVNSIQMNHVFLNIDCSNILCTKNNWLKILNKMKRKKQKEKEREVIIRRLELKDFTVNIRGMGFDSHSSSTSHFDSFVFSNISSKEGFPTEQVIFAVFKSAGIKKYLEDFLQLEKSLKKVIKPIFGEKRLK